jgi:Holliday junction resolvase
MNAKRKGTRNEHKSIRILETAGYACTRAAASLGLSILSAFQVSMWSSCK